MSLLERISKKEFEEENKVEILPQGNAVSKNNINAYYKFFLLSK